MKRRLDQWLVEKGLASSRTRAADMIRAGRVSRGAEVISKASAEVFENDRIVVAGSDDDRFVSRAGSKLSAALAELELDPTGLRVLDVGQSTGGFTDCLLQAGVREVVGVDVGHGQIHPKILADARVRVVEGVNAKQLSAQGLGVFDWIVVDVSFISLTLVLEGLNSARAPGARLLALVKPQFEVGAENLGKGGIVRDAGLYAGVEQKIKLAAEEKGWKVQDYIPSALPGKDGNQEFFIHALTTV